MDKRVLKSLVMAAVSSVVAANSYAIGNGFYMGLMMGPSTNNAPSLQALRANAPTPPPPAPPVTTIADPKIQQFASRLFIGNKFNTYAAIEGGVTFFSSIKYDSHGVQTVGSTDQRVRDLDIVVKGIFPFGNYFDVYAKGGMAVTYITSGGSFNPVYNPDTMLYNTSSEYKQKFSPTFSIGASYDINQSWVADFSYNTVQVGNNVGTLTFYGVGISYHFTDKYCGQFLCDD